MNTSRPVIGHSLLLPPAGVIVLAMFMLSCMLPLRTASAVDHQQEPLNVLIFNGTDPYLPAFVELDRAMRERIQAGIDRHVDFYSETLDVERFPRDLLEPELGTLLARKYRDLDVDAVIALTAQAFTVAQSHAGRLWPDAVIVSYAIGPPSSLTPRPGPRTTGLAVRYEMAETIELGMKLVPNARRLVVVAGSSSFDRHMTELARAGHARVAGAPDADYILGMPLPTLVEEISALPQDTIVLYLSMFRDAEGGRYVPRRVLETIAEASPVPVVSPVASYMGAGIVTGSMSTYAEQGNAIGDIVLEAIRGEESAVPPVAGPLPGRCLADWTMLQRLGLDGSRLPQECEIRYREPSAWERYGWQISAAGAVIVLQALLIAALLLQRRRRARAEIALQENRVELAHAGRRATLGQLTASIAHEVNQPLAAILTNADAAEMLLASERPDLPTVRQIVADIRRDDQRASEVVQRLRSLLARGEMENRRLSLNDAIREVLHILKTEITRRGVHVHTSLSAALPDVRGDRVHLQQVILNLIINAMDAMSDIPPALRRIDIGTALTGKEEVEVQVCDRGHGIAPDARPKLFHAFHSGKKGSLGLGLSIARSIVESHGGRIRAEDNPGAGAIFRFTLPVAPREATAPHPGTSPLPSGGTA